MVYYSYTAMAALNLIVAVTEELYTFAIESVQVLIRRITTPQMEVPLPFREITQTRDGELHLEVDEDEPEVATFKSASEILKEAPILLPPETHMALGPTNTKGEKNTVMYAAAERVPL